MKSPESFRGVYNRVAHTTIVFSANKSAHITRGITEEGAFGQAKDTRRLGEARGQLNASARGFAENAGIVVGGTAMASAARD